MDDRRTLIRPRRRRGLVSWRLYRLLALLALVPPLLVLLTPRDVVPPPLPARPIDFDGAAAATFAARLPPAGERVAGTPGDLAAADWVRARFGELGLEVSTAPFAADVPWSDAPLAMENVLGLARGDRDELVAVVAHRDAPPDGRGGASGTGVMLELARQLGGRPEGRGVLFVSTDGAEAGARGAEALVSEGRFAERIVAAVVLGELAPARGTGLRVDTRADLPRAPAAGLVEAARSALRQAGIPVEVPGAWDQITGYALPYARGEQGTLLAHGTSAIRMAATDAAPVNRLGAPSPAALERTGAAVAALVTSLQAAPTLGEGGSPAIFLQAKVLRGWLVQLALVGLLLPVVGCLLETVARARRARVALRPAVRAVAWRSATWLVGLAAFWATTVVPGGLASGVAIAPVPGRTGLSASAVLLALATALLFWRFVARPRLAPDGATGPAERSAGLVAALVCLCGAALVLAAVNPYALVLVLPAAHVWLLLPAAARIGRRAMTAVLAAGAIGPALVVGELWLVHDLGADAVAVLLAATASGYLPPAISAPLAVAGACAAQLGAIVLGRYAPAHAPLTSSPRPV